MENRANQVRGFDLFVDDWGQLTVSVSSNSGEFIADLTDKEMYSIDEHINRALNWVEEHPDTGGYTVYLMEDCDTSFIMNITTTSDKDWFCLDIVQVVNPDGVQAAVWQVTISREQLAQWHDMVLDAEFRLDNEEFEEWDDAEGLVDD